MNTLHYYRIEEGEQFNSINCPMVVGQLLSLKEGMALLPHVNKDDIVISFLKDHSIKNDWIASNPEVSATMITSSFAVSHIEAYFESCKGNTSFSNSFESFIKNYFSTGKRER
jgi:hypothetical protein